MKALTAMICLVCLLGCSRTPFHQQPVQADTPINFALWRSKNSDALSNKQWSLFDQAMVELKLQIMLAGQASGGDSVDLALRTKIDGMKLRDVMISGLQLRLKRLSAEKAVLEESLSFNSQLKLKPGNDEKAQMLAEKVRAQTDRLADLQKTVTEAESDLHALELKFK